MSVQLGDVARCEASRCGLDPRLFPVPLPDDSSAVVLCAGRRRLIRVDYDVGEWQLAQLLLCGTSSLLGRDIPGDGSGQSGLDVDLV